MRLTSVHSFCAMLLLAATSSAQTEVEYFTFINWDHDAIVSGGQTFPNILEGIDVTVTATGVFDAPSSGGAAINSSHEGATSHMFAFEFSQPVRLGVQLMHLDLNEKYTIDGPGTEVYTNLMGDAPTQTPLPVGLQLEGLGIGPTAANGVIAMSRGGTQLTVRYEAVDNTVTKYSRFLVGQLVPEPSSDSLLLSSTLCVLFFRRRRPTGKPI